MNCTKWKIFISRKKGGLRFKRVDYFLQGHLRLSKSRGLIRQIVSLVWIRKFQIDWLKTSLLGDAETAIWLVINFCFGDWLSKSDTILDYCFFFINRVNIYLVDLFLLLKGSRVFHPKLCFLGNVDYFSLVIFKKQAWGNL